MGGHKASELATTHLKLLNGFETKKDLSISMSGF